MTDPQGTAVASTRLKSSRLDHVAASHPAAWDRVDELIALAVRGLPKMYRSNGNRFVQTLRAVQSTDGLVMRAEGDNLRYAAIVALGLNWLPAEIQREVLSGTTAADLALSTAVRAESVEDPGAIALAAWAAAEVAATFSSRLYDRLSSLLSSGAPVPTVDCSWALSAALAAGAIGDTDLLRDNTASRLREAQGPGGLFPHMLPAQALGRFRAHVGCYADQVYPIQAFARLAAATGDAETLMIANECAERICHLQGPAGQWWWHYDARHGSVVEGFPVYSVHQHAMGPMALLDLAEAGGNNHLSAIALGVGWLDSHPETLADLVSEKRGVVWRKVGRREPAKAARKLSAVTTSLRPGLRMPGIDRAFPATKVDYECRPYELGWLLYAWLAGGVVNNLAQRKSADG